MDIFSPEKRHEIMSRVKNKNTKPELIVRSLLHRLGYRFRLHRRDLPGTPDIVLPKYKTVIFVHGCFWHGHNCKRGKLPETNRTFWEEKISKNIQRDRNATIALKKEGWRKVIVWDCETSSQDRVAQLVARLERVLK